MSARYAIGTVTAGNFEADTLGQDPELTTHATLEAAIADIEELIASAAEMWGEPIENGAIYDNEEQRVVWRQPTPEEAFEASSEPIYAVLDDEGRNVAGAQLRHTAHGWAYVDESEGWSYVRNREAKRLLANSEVIHDPGAASR